MITAADAVAGLIDLALDDGLDPPPASRFKPGRYVRGPGYGKGSRNDATAYKVEPGRVHAWIGSYHDHSSGMSGFWHPKAPPTVVDREVRQAEFHRRQAESQCKRAQSEAEVAATAKRIVQSARPVTDNEYLRAKSLAVAPCSMFRQDDRGALLVPMLDIHGRIWNRQIVFCDETSQKFQKRFLKGGRIKGLGLQFGSGGVLVFAEGVSTALSIYHATRLTTVCCFSAGNVEAVARAHRSQTMCRFVFAADYDSAGLKAVESATQSVRGEIVMPATTGLDFNDIHAADGEGAVRAYFAPWLERDGG